MAPTTKGPYSRIYHSLMDDPDFEGVYESDRLFATWVRMLMMADAFWPNSAPMPTRNATVAKLVNKGLVIPTRGNRYTIRGLEAERERRSSSARNAAAVRWHSERNAGAMPRREETRKEEGIALRSNGAHPRGTPKLGTHEGQHPDCSVCAPLQAPRS